MDEKLSLRYQLLSAWCGPAFLLTFIVFWGIVGTNLPAPVSPALNPHDVAVRYLGSWTQMRIGFGISLNTVVLYLPWTALLTVQMARRSGKIVSISSDAGRVGSAGEAVYAGAKAGIIGFSKTLARELARYGINVNVVCPGPTNTPLFHEMAGGNGKLAASLKQAIPLGRLGEPEDLAVAVAFLASDDASFVTGQTLSVSGGLTMI